jgi:hypothetical protein
MELRVPLEINAAGLKTRQIEGYGSTFGNVFAGMTFAQGSFTESLKRHESAGTRPLMLWGHDQFQPPIGVWEKLSEDSRGLYLVGTLADTPIGNQVRELLKMGAFDGLSIGGTVESEEYVDELRVIEDFDLWEISPVNFPRNPAARIKTVMSADGYTERQLERALRGLGYSKSESRRILYGPRSQALDAGGKPAPRWDAENADAATIEALKAYTATLERSTREE